MRSAVKFGHPSVDSFLLQQRRRDTPFTLCGLVSSGETARLRLFIPPPLATQHFLQLRWNEAFGNLHQTCKLLAWFFPMNSMNNWDCARLA